MADFNIFISHKHEDGSSAIAVKKVLERYGGNRLEVFISDEILWGDNWLDWIRSSLGKSQVLLLLFTDPSKSWDWCLYEAGMFTGLEGDHHRRVVCIHNPDSPPPDPLKHLQACPVKENKLAQFIRQLFCECTLTRLDEPLNKNICTQPEEIERAAKELVAALERAPSCPPIYFGEHLVLHIEDRESITEDKIPPDATVQGDEGCLSLFGKIAGEWRWGDLEEAARKTLDQRWLRELANAVYFASRGIAFEPVQATFSPYRGTKVYRPILHSMERQANGSIDFKILFEADVSWNLKDIPPAVAVALTAQVMAVRFRYEVLQKYDSRLDSIEIDETNEGIFKEIREAIEKIEEEAKSRGILKKDLLASVFDGDKTRVCEMFDDWYDVKCKLFEACEKKEADETRRLIQKLLEYNTEFIPMAAKNYYKLVEEALDREKFAIPIM
jgi:hypothetical protein